MKSEGHHKAKQQKAGRRSDPSCLECGAPMKTSRQAHRYTVAGDWAVTLKSVPVHRCPRCGYGEVGIELPNALNRTIAREVIRKRGGLSGPEIVFLRQYLGMSGRGLARTLGVTDVSVSRWEHRRLQIGPVPDRLLRTLVALKGLDGETFPVEVLEEIDGKAEPLRLVIGLGRDGEWRLAA